MPLTRLGRRARRPKDGDPTADANEPAPAPAPKDPAPDRARGLSPHTKSGHRRIAVLGLMVGMLLGALDNTIVVTALPAIVTDLNDRSGLAFVVSAYLIAQTISMPVFGKLSDKFGRRRFFLLGLVIFMAGSVLSGVAQTLDELILFRAIQGVGSGAFFPVANAIVGVLFDAKERARLTGAFAATFGISSVLGPLLGSWIVDVTTWRWIFYINLPLGVASFALIVSSLGPLRDHRPGRFDAAGAALLAAWVAAFMLVLEETAATNGWKWTDPVSIGVLALGAVFFAGFLWWESRVEDPVIPLKFFRIRVVNAANAVSFLRGFVLITVITYASIFVAFALGENTDAVRNTLYGLLIPMVIGAGLGGGLLPRLGYRPIMTLGMALMALGAALLTTVTAATPSFVGVSGGLPTGLFLFLMPVGFGIGMTFAPATIVVQNAVPKKDIGVATSLVQFMMNIGGAFGVSILGSYQQNRFAQLAPAPPAGPPTPAYFQALQAAGVTSIHEIYLVVAVVAAVAIIPALFVTGKLYSETPEESAPAMA